LNELTSLIIDDKLAQGQVPGPRKKPSAGEQ